jgi:hypothetical protein
MKLLLKNYFLPTPKALRILGDSFLSFSVLVTTTAILNDKPTLAIIASIAGWFGKCLTNFATINETL